MVVICWKLLSLFFIVLEVGYRIHTYYRFDSPTWIDMIEAYYSRAVNSILVSQRYW
jgi:hypothetical protein